MHTGVWEAIADALFWLQLALVFSGFILMAYLALKVFPGSPNPPDLQRDEWPDQDRSSKAASADEPSDRDQARLMVAGNYRLESFPAQGTGSAKVIEFPSKMSGAL